MLLAVDDVAAAATSWSATGLGQRGLSRRRQNPDRRVPGPDPDHGSYKSFATFADPDGNTWLLQEVTTRLAGRVWQTDVGGLAALLKETSEHHGAFEAVAPKHDWWDWYAAYVDARSPGAPRGGGHGRRTYMAEVKHIVV